MCASSLEHLVIMAMLTVVFPARDKNNLQILNHLPLFGKSLKAYCDVASRLPGCSEFVRRMFFANRTLVSIIFAMSKVGYLGWGVEDYVLCSGDTVSQLLDYGAPFVLPSFSGGVQGEGQLL